MTSIEPPVLGKHAIAGQKRLRRVVPLITAAALSAALVATAAAPATAAVREPATVDSARVVVVDVAQVVPANAQDTTVTILPGITLTINSTGIQLSLTKEAVTEVENVVGFGQSVASLVGAILSAAKVPYGPEIASIVGAALGVANGFLKLCTASDGSATFTVPYPWLGLPSCSGLNLV